VAPVLASLSSKIDEKNLREKQAFAGLSFLLKVESATYKKLFDLLSG
jgi:hypothetical protein